MKSGISQKLASQSHRTLGENIDKIFSEMDALKQMIALQKREIHLYEELIRKKDQAIHLLEIKNKEQARKIDALETENKLLRQQQPQLPVQIGIFAHSKRKLSTKNSTSTLIGRPAWR